MITAIIGSARGGRLEQPPAPLTMANSPHRSSLHEASHAVAAYFQYIPIRAVTLDPPCCVAAVPDLGAVASDPAARAKARASAVVALAGLAMDAILGVDRDPAYAAAMAEGLNTDYTEACDCVDAHELFYDDLCDAPAMMLERLAGRARALVIGHWQEIALIAAELERLRRLTGAEVAQVITTGRGLSRPAARPSYAQWRQLFAEIASRYTGQ